jgi:hypothetical protein
MSALRNYQAVLQAFPELRGYECEKCAADLHAGFEHPDWKEAAMFCMSERYEVDNNCTTEEAVMFIESRFAVLSLEARPGD